VIKIKLTFAILTLYIQTFAQLSLSTSVTQNSNCNGVGCNYVGPSIIINEVMLCPSQFDGSIYGTGPGFSPNTNAGEWIELYNPDYCYPKDISGFLLGNNAPESGTNRGGGFVIPPNTIVPSRGFCVVRGVNATPVPSNLLVQNGGNTVEIIVNTPNVCIDGGNRLWFPNSGGWFAFYDRNGNPQDAISWATVSNSCTNCNPCVPSTSSFVGSLRSYDSIPASLKNYISVNPPTAGQTFKRNPDGGLWQTSIPGSPTLGTCNGTCNPGMIATCNGTATVVANAGTPPYSYYWSSGSSPINSLDSGLCGGVYSVTVTDNNGVTQSTSVSVPNWVPSSSFTLSKDTFCVGNTSLATYTGDVSDTANFVWTPTGATLNSGIGVGPHTISTNVEGDHSLSLVVTQNGCQSPPTIHNFHVYSIGALITNIRTPLCFQTATGELNASGSNGIIPYQYYWSNGVTTQNNPNILAGTYSVTITDAIGCSATNSSILADQTPITATTSTIPESCINFCDGQATVIASGSVAPYTYQWENNPSNTATAINYCYGNYSVTITDSNGCTKTTTFYINQATPILAQGHADPTSGIAPADIQFIFDGSGATTYLWYFGDGGNSSLENPTHQYLSPGNYSIMLVVTSGAPNYCSDSTTIQIEIKPPSNVIIPNIFTPNSDGFNDEFFALSNGLDSESMKIFNRWGRLVFSSETISEHWNGSDNQGNELADGIYFYVYNAIGFDLIKYNFHGTITLMR